MHMYLSFDKQVVSISDQGPARTSLMKNKDALQLQYD